MKQAIDESQSPLRINGMIEINRDDDALFCNCKWDEATGLHRESWECYMELGKKLRALKDGKHKSKFTEWCKAKLEFSYEWANVLIKAYSRYELSEFKDEPQSNLKLYANLNHGSDSEIETEENIMKEKKTKETIAKVLSKIDAYCNDQEFDDLQKDVMKAWYTLSKKIIKKYGDHGVEEAIELINTNPKIHKI